MNTLTIRTSALARALTLAGLCALSGAGLGACGGGQKVETLEAREVEVRVDPSIGARTVEVDLVFVPASDKPKWDAKGNPDYFGGDPLRTEARQSKRAVNLTWGPGDTGAKRIGVKTHPDFWAMAEKSGSATMLVLAEAGGISSAAPGWRKDVPMGEDRWSGRDVVQIVVGPAGLSLVKEPQPLKP
jgi:hypothetical protein